MRTVLAKTDFECATCGNPCVAHKFLDVDGDHRVNIDHEAPHCNSFKTLTAPQFMKEAVDARYEAARIKFEEEADEGAK